MRRGLRVGGQASRPGGEAMGEAQMPPAPASETRRREVPDGHGSRKSVRPKQSGGTPGSAHVPRRPPNAMRPPPPEPLIVLS